MLEVCFANELFYTFFVQILMLEKEILMQIRCIEFQQYLKGDHDNK